MKIALITPKHKNDYLTDTVIDGLLDLGVHTCAYSSDYTTALPIAPWKMAHAEFVKFAREADVIFLFWGKGNTDDELAQEIGEWKKTIYIDGSEPGGNRRYEGPGQIHEDYLSKCRAYFRRELPYGRGVRPFPFGIERKYLSAFRPDKNKDIDFACIFGQEEYPTLRRDVRKHLEKFCKKNGFICATKKTKTREEFYDILSRTKVGVSVGGGGFDTARFWEILGNNCILMTEKIDIYEPGSNALKYDRIREFTDIDSFKAKLEEMAAFLRSGYRYESMTDEYATLVKAHSTRARAQAVLDAAGVLR